MTDVRALRAVIDYLWKDEKRSYMEQYKRGLGKCEHIFHLLKRLDAECKALERGDVIELSWCIEDVLSLPAAKRARLTKEEARDVLGRVYKRADAEFGVCWETLTCQITEVVNER